MKVKDFLRSHPGISPSWVERTLNMPKSTIRLTNDKPIPDKYKDQIISLLNDYGLNSSIQVAPTIITKEVIKEVRPLISNWRGYYLKLVKTTIASTGWYLCAFRKNSDPAQKDIKVTVEDVPEKTKINIMDEKIS
jgi:hypothetical protein